MRLTRFHWLVYLAASATAAAAQSADNQPSVTQIHEWIRQRHPALVAGDSGLNAAIVVVDAQGKLVKSIAARLDTAEMAVADRRFSEMRSPADEGPLLTRCLTAPGPTERERPLCIVNGVRVPWIDAFQSLAIRERERLEGPVAVARFGPDAKAGVISATVNAAALARLRNLGYDPAKAGDVMT